jgi:RNA polymerase sigma-B factor
MSGARSTERSEERFDRERARALFRSFAESRDPATREELVLTHVNLVRYLAARFANRGEQPDDLIQVGTLGLIKAIDRYDVARGVEFTTYATPTIIGEIKRHFRDKGWAVKVPRRLQELNLAVNRSVEKLAVELGRSPTVRDLSERLGATDEEIIEAQELGQAYNLLSLDTELGQDGEARSATLLDYVGAEDGGFAALDDRAGLERGFTVLDKRERVIIYLRFFENLSQADIAKRMNVSQMHVSRLQQRALSKLKQYLQDA